MSKTYRLRVVNVFHAGDGNLHPLILFDANDPTNSVAPRNSAPISCGSACGSAAC
jgi:FAD/FMN-containing dehydrogenases